MSVRRHVHWMEPQGDSYDSGKADEARRALGWHSGELRFESWLRYVLALWSGASLSVSPPTAQCSPVKSGQPTCRAVWGGSESTYVKCLAGSPVYNKHTMNMNFSFYFFLLSHFIQAENTNNPLFQIVVILIFSTRTGTKTDYEKMW